MSFDPKTMNDRDLTYEGLNLAIWLRTLRQRLAAKKADIEAEKAQIRDVERNLERINQELHTRVDPKGNPYHDIGHAREQFETKVVAGKRIPLTPEELDPVVATYLYLNRRWIFE